MSIYHYVDGLCGAAKTYAAIRYAHRLARLGKKVLFVQPSIYLITQTLADLEQLVPAVRSRAIHGDTSARVIADIVDHIKHTAQDGEILFITHSALMLLPYFHRKQDWHVIMDEVPQADWCGEFNIPDTHRLITDCFVVEPEADSLADNRYVRALPSDGHRLEAMARNKNGDQIWGVFQQFANLLLSPHWSTYVLDDQYTNLIRSHGKRRKLLTFAHLKPSLLEGFASATLMGACFKDSVLYQIWMASGVEFRQHKGITKRLRYLWHSNGELLTIRYATEEDWSKNFRDKAVEGETVNDRVIQRVREVFSGADFVWMGNKDTPDGVFGGRGHRLPNSPFGLNPYQHIHQAVVLSALNPPPAHFAFLDALGFNSREVKRAGYWQAAYQAAMRTSLRNPEDKNLKTVIVMDRATAEWMSSLFPDCTVGPLGGLGELPAKGKPGRHRTHASSADRKRANRDRFKLELQAALDLINGGDEVIGQFPQLAEELRQQMSEFGHGEHQALPIRGGADLDRIGGTIYASIYHAEPLDFFPRDDTEAFIDGLRFFHGLAHENKASNGLISPGIFDPALADETKRGLANIRAIWGIWLDNDGGDLSPDEFASLFPRLRMAIFNSYSSTPEKPRWRVFIPTTVAMPIAAYRAIAEQIMRTVNRAGYWSRKQLQENARIKSRQHHGFDMSKLTPSSLFYLPCQAQNPSDSFFIDFRDASRSALDPYQWAGYAANHRLVPEPVEPAEPTVIEQSIPEAPCPRLRLIRERLREEGLTALNRNREEARTEATQRWRTTPPGTGDQAFFQLAVDLRGTGMDWPEIEMKLREEAAYGRHPIERRAQVKNITRTLARSGKMAA